MHDDQCRPGNPYSLLGRAHREAAFYPYLSARDNLWVMAQMSGGGVSRARLDAVLEQVVLASRTASKVRTYSLGMKR
jgi:ABC-type multidrug transport system ATPase subunit